MTVGGPLCCVGEFELVSLKRPTVPSSLWIGCFVLVRHNIGRASRTGTPAAATIVRCCRCRCCADEDLLANARAEHQLLRIPRCAIIVISNCVRHTFGGALHSICRYHERKTRLDALCVLTRVMSDANDHCSLHHNWHIYNLVGYEVQGRSGQTRSDASAFCVVRSHRADKCPHDMFM